MFSARTVRACIFGAVVTLVPLAAEAASPVKVLGRQFFNGECQFAGGAGDVKGKICVRRGATDRAGRLAYFITFDGIWTHANIIELQTQYELSRLKSNATATLTKPMARNSVLVVKVQICKRPALGPIFGAGATSTCTFWTQLRIRM